MNLTHLNGSDQRGRKLVSLAMLAARWSCSRQTVRRVMKRHGVRPLFLGGDSRNATLRFDLDDVRRVEGEAQGPEHLDCPSSGGRRRGEHDGE